MCVACRAYSGERITNPYRMNICKFIVIVYIYDLAAKREAWRKRAKGAITKRPSRLPAITSVNCQIMRMCVCTYVCAC